MLKKFQTSKIILLAVMVFGLLGIAVGFFNSPPPLTAYGLIFAGALYNRIDSRFRSYKFSVNVGNTSATMETGEVYEE